MAVIESVEFNNRTPDKLNELKYGKNWPVVYILNNDKEAYIGENHQCSHQILLNI